MGIIANTVLGLVDGFERYHVCR